ncbi:hypothetical protein DUZ99_13330 [Xylanibacillus composti]|uniref:Uncharacterized protein n=1 Tax=Xylanibacillus composti TaxID=1572762 RepID=A0A8J4H4W1_9BACL|nr:hypothetical protein [Xylanibacillus composti]MDT9725957.1 hypothetical protein [Xylanibacillus composti]GIQ70889.1 hypothetical protein XYCOK13_37130 [Xylanibacillus composti]
MTSYTSNSDHPVEELEHAATVLGSQEESEPSIGGDIRESVREQPLPSRTERSAEGSRQRARRRYIGLGLAALLSILILLETLVFRNTDFYGYSPGFIGQLAELKASYAQEEPAQIKVAIFGDSMSLDALRPEIMEDEAGWPRGTVFNFSLSGGSAFDMYKTYKSYESRLPAMEHAIIVVNEHQINNAEAAKDIKFKFYANLNDRLQVINRDNYGELLLGWAWKGYEMREVWKMMLDKYRHDREHPDEPKQLRDEIPAYPGGIKPLTWSPRTDKTYEYAEEVAARWFDPYVTEGVRTEALGKLIRELTESGVQVTILQIPRTPFFEQAVSAKYEDKRQEYLAIVQGYADEYGAAFTVMSNEGLDPETDFRDTNHVSPDGAEKVSRDIARRWLVP